MPIAMNEGSPRPLSHRPPTGSRDLLPLEVVQRQWVEQCLSEIFRRWGYQQIITPTLERLSTLTAGGLIQSEALLQLRDAEGSPLGLRPEFTASIVRATATRMAQSPLPQRLFYHGSVFRNAPQEQEFFQSGVELIGAAGWQADAEVLLVLSEALQALPLPNWTLILGDIGVTQRLLNLLSPTAHLPIRQAIAQLDYVYLETAPLPERDRQIGLQILNLRGQPSAVLHKLGQLSLPLPQQERVQDLQRVCQVLEQQGVKLVLDLSLLQSFAYYTGIVFQVSSQQEIIGMGGRYDQLFALYSPSQVDQPGIGFTLLLEKLQRQLIPSATLPQTLPSSQRLLVALTPDAFPPALHLAQMWRQHQPSAIIELELLNRSPEALEAYARQRGIPEIVWVQADGSTHTSDLS
ncbi:MAG: ATP phosphoribosyltransferase regulatory subunit [Cyanobacteriota bacterium]|nr:ATP phosphoribosyltransferase regulatory subunit [Cyanobacteriota bacterium]